MHAFWEVVASNSVVVVVLAVGVSLLGRYWKYPAVLHLLWVCVLLKFVTPPIFTVPIPLPVHRPPLAVQVREANQDVRDPAPLELSRQQEVTPVSVDRQGRLASVERATSTTLALPTGDKVSVSRPQMPRLTVLAWTWGAGVALLVCLHARRILRFRRLLRSAEAPPSALLSMGVTIAKRLRLRRLPEIALLPVRLSPLVWSMGGRPRVLLPAELFQRLDADAQETILAHELAHVLRKDHWVRLLELLATTLFWWHPVVWWACRQLRELEEQCCDGLVLNTVPHGPWAYATALLDTLDFLSESSARVPAVATAANSPLSVARRIKMLNDQVPVVRLTMRRLAIVSVMAVIPMAVAFAVEPPPTSDRSSSDRQPSTAQPAVQRRAVNRLVKDFSEKLDLSTPESAQAAWSRASARMDAKAICELGAWTFGSRDIETMERFWKRDPQAIAVYNEAQRNAEIAEVATYREDLADVISKLNFPEGIGRDPYSSRCFGKFNGVWKNLGEDRLPSLEAARETFDEKKDILWQEYVNVRDSLRQGRPVAAPGRVKSTDRSARIAPGEAMGISVEKADLMGRIEWAMMHGGRDITARKSIEWGEVQKDEKGNRTIRYKYFATIWDKDVYIMNQVFTFDAKGNILNMENVEGFPQEKVERPVNVATQEGMKELVEDFFKKNFRDVTSRETIEWGEVIKAENGNASIRYKYRAKIWHKDTKIMNQVFTFDPKGKFVSVEDVEGFPQNP